MKKIICPGCGWDSKIMYLISKNSYQCIHCGQVWKRDKKLAKEKRYSCPNCGHRWEEKDILLSENVVAEEG